MTTKLWIQPGHGRGDPGATHNGRTEAKEAKKLVDQAVKKAKPHIASGHKLKKMRNMRYVKAVNTFTRNAGSLDPYLEIHFNSNAGQPGSGTEVWYGHKATARTLQEALVKVLELADRGTKHSNQFYVTTKALAGGQSSGVIVEMCFINNDNDMKVFDRKGVEALATALVSLTHGKYTPLPGKSEELTKLQKLTRLAEDRLKQIRSLRDKVERLQKQRDNHRKQRRHAEKRLDDALNRIADLEHDIQTKGKKLSRLSGENKRLKSKQISLSDAFNVIIEHIKGVWR